MRKEIVHISPVRAGLLSAAIAVVIYVAFGLVIGVAGMMNNYPPTHEGYGPADLLASGVFALIFGLFSGGIGGFLSGWLGALIYNLVAAVIGGVVIELRDA